MKTKQNKKMGLVGFGLLMLLATNVKAATLAVDNNDPGCSDIVGTPYCTVQAAVTAALDDDTITIANGIYYENIIAPSKGLILIGEDRDNTILDGGLASGVLNFVSVTDENVDLQNLTVRNGSQASGGGLLLNTGTIDITNCTFRTNRASTATGAAIYLSSGDVAIADSLFTQNSALVSTGGVIVQLSGNLDIQNSEFTSNTAVNVAGIYKGGTGDTTITDSTFSNNTATGTGGAIYIADGNFMIENTTIDGNSANMGAGVIASGTSITISNSSITNNQATGNSVGGLYIIAGTLTIDGSDISDNQAASSVGGIYHATSDEMILSNSTVDNNQTSGSIGGVYHADGNTIITNTSITNNMAITSVGGFYQGGGTVTIEDSQIAYNSATGSVGGLYLAAIATISNTSIHNNTAAVIGGMYYANVSPLEMTNSSITQNYSAGAGGGLYLAGPGNIVNTTISGNRADDAGGGIVASANLLLRNVTIANNSADDDNSGVGSGGGIYIVAGTTTAQNSIVAQNTAFANADCMGTFTSEGYNLMQDTTGCTLAGSTTGMITGVDPDLEALAGNGATTFSHALTDTSPALDAGNPSGCLDAASILLTDDQRGFTRPLGSACDMGAYEYGCGNGAIDGSEACDDGNNTSGDGCSDTCANEVAPACGDGIIQVGESCDDSNITDGDGCSATCADESIAVTESSASNSSGGGCTLIGTTSASNAWFQVILLGMALVSLVTLRKKAI
ncbi:MAG: hypothetical protein A3G32_00080 [Deltaproteobacteria bacterium RIFCSPLOWO2_12_FULL_40_28]|nr:MAG: hypothetical protein A3C45_04570 [Deltaproteobacteria bacterium RIFCSPHIGHO2_02_FULL_40_28]OGQ20550.1 MAG: hypothetical protein A3E27_00845 [Deltaproteobacteria bacterium RIFCSPHIGHO2_12_FULL_40_32]OGQ41220.1 MAG: hypothetical protein A3I69_05660 [Deltaproteobacteria bacterium RIFCSPLOWO2_02_FULL_40_36]OGQ55195.1 MAG: hypothetical protein A3G32_00080 [Deltaproteobacteria bacterium RIFCSPLOWO2_12_FULL_40_28]